MAYLKGEDINIGFSKETTRGTYLAPTTWIPGRTPTGLKATIESVPVKETRGTGISSQGAEITQLRAEGDFEFNVRNNSLGSLLLSLLGKVTSTSSSGAFTHVFGVLAGNAQHPSLSMGISSKGFQDYKYTRGLCTQLAFKVETNDLVSATASLIATKEETVADYTPTFPTSDVYFRHQDAEVKVASSVAGLSGATALSLKSVSATITNNGRVDQTIGSLNPTDVFGLDVEPTGSLALTKSDETFHDAYYTGAYQALSITFKRADVTIGSATNPTLTIVFPKVSFSGFDPDRTLDDVVTEGLDFTAHYDDTASAAVTVTLLNTVASY